MLRVWYRLFTHYHTSLDLSNKLLTNIMSNLVCECECECVCVNALFRTSPLYYLPSDVCEWLTQLEIGVMWNVMRIIDISETYVSNQYTHLLYLMYEHDCILVTKYFMNVESDNNINYLTYLSECCSYNAIIGNSIMRSSIIGVNIGYTVYVWFSDAWPVIIVSENGEIRWMKMHHTHKAHSDVTAPVDVYADGYLHRYDVVMWPISHFRCWTVVPCRINVYPVETRFCE